MPDGDKARGFGQMVSLRNKIITVMVVVILLFGLGMMLFTQIKLTRILTQERQHWGIIVSQDISLRSVDFLLKGDLPGLQRFIEDVESKHAEHFAYIFVVDKEGRVLANTFKEGFGKELIRANKISPDQSSNIQLLETKQGWVYDIAIPIFKEGGVIGTTRVGINEEYIRKAVTNIVGAVMGVTALAMGIGIVVALGLASFITRPLSELTEAARAVGGGDLERQVDIRTNDEIGQLGKIFNQMTADLRKATELTATVTQNLMEGVMLLSKDFRILWANKKIKEFSGLEEKDIIGNFCYRVTHGRKDPCQPPHDICPVNKLMETGKPTVELHIHFDKEGNEHHVEVTVEAVRDEKGEIVQFIHVTRDVTEIMKAKKELEKAYEEIKELNAGLEQKVEERTRALKQAQAQLVQSGKLAAIGELGAGVAHELNNPVGGILGYAQYLQEKINKPGFQGEDFKACKKYLGYIEKEAERCKTIVENLLKFSRRSPEKFEPLNINQVLEDTLAITAHQLMIKKIKLKKELAPHLNPVEGNANQLQQVFINLILNAQQAMAEGGELTIATRLKVKSQKLEVKDEKCLPETNFVEIVFRDTGCGIPPENLDKIFDPFFTTKMDWRGTGLGLSVSYEIVQHHKGRIEVESEVGKGTTFTISLPVKA